MIMRVRVMTWNVWWRFGPRWQARQPGILRTLREADADVVALQEVWGTAETTQPDELAAQLGMHAGFAAPSYPPETDVPRADDAALGIGILSRWPILALRPEPMPARHRAFDPVALVATLDAPQGALHVIVACLEYDPAYNDDRLAQAGRIAELATDPALDGACPVVVAGDLNAPADSRVLRPLTDVLTDAWTAGGGDPATTTAPPDAGPELKDRRIDHVLYRPGRFAQQVTVAGATRADGPSDHRAIVVDLGWS
jgi:endonuclease/exonuclease/phosphatase family metal-dependent hydrolase